MKNNKWLMIAAGIVVVVLIGLAVNRIMSGKNNAAKRPIAVRVKILKPARQDVRSVLSFNGDVLAIQQANIYSKVGGTLEKVRVQIGDRVRTNQLIARIDTAELSEQAQQAVATYKNTRLTFNRTKELTDQNLTSKQDLDNAEAAMNVAKANNELAQTRLSYAFIAAPFDGYVTKRFFDPGTVVTTNQTLFMLMDLDVVKVMIHVLEKDYPLLKLHDAATITVDAYPGKIFHGSIARFSEAIDLSTRTMDVEIDVQNRDLLLKPGMFASITLPVETHVNALTVPTEAVLTDPAGTYVLVVENNIAKRMNLKIGFQQADATEILYGLSDGQDVIVVGQQLIRNGSAVSVAK